MTGSPFRKGTAGIIYLLLLVSGVAMLLCSCHAEYVCLDYTVHHGPQWNTAHTHIAFAASKKAYRNAAGIARFPDGGIPDYLLENTGLYIFNPETLILTQVVDFNDLTALWGSSRSKWKIKMAFTESRLYYHVSPMMGWEWYVTQAKTTEDSSKISYLKKKYAVPYAVTTHTKEITVADASVFLPLYENNEESHKANLTALNKQLAQVPLKAWGLVLKEIYPKTDEAYIEETIYLQNPSKIARRAVIEQIISKLDREEIKILLQKMEDHKNSLKGLKKTEYEMYSKETYQQIKDLL